MVTKTPLNKWGSTFLNRTLKQILVCRNENDIMLPRFLKIEKTLWIDSNTLCGLACSQGLLIWQQLMTYCVSKGFLILERP